MPRVWLTKAKCSKLLQRLQEMRIEDTELVWLGLLSIGGRAHKWRIVPYHECTLNYEVDVVDAFDLPICSAIALVTR
jgi:hypothetical protein